MHRRHWLACVVGSALLAHLPTTLAQSPFPDQPIKWVVPYPAGGGTDVLARSLAEGMRTAFSQPIIIENRPGAATNLGGEYVARSRADGHTVMSADNALLAFNEHLFSKLTFNPAQDFTYVGAIGRFPLALVVHPDFPAQNLEEFLAYTRANPGKVNFASVGNGSPHHLAMELFKNRTGTNVLHIPYRGAAPAMQDLMGGQVDAMFLDLASGLGIITSGRVRPLAIASAQRTPVMPDLPTLAESEIADAEVFAFQGMLAPAGLPEDITRQLNTALNAALDNPKVLAQFTEFGFEPLRGTPEEFQALARAEASRWGEVIRTNAISLD